MTVLQAQQRASAGNSNGVQTPSQGAKQRGSWEGGDPARYGGQQPFRQAVGPGTMHQWKHDFCRAWLKSGGLQPYRQAAGWHHLKPPTGARQHASLQACPLLCTVGYAGQQLFRQVVVTQSMPSAMHRGQQPYQQAAGLHRLRLRCRCHPSVLSRMHCLQHASCHAQQGRGCAADLSDPASWWLQSKPGPLPASPEARSLQQDVCFAT